MNMKRYSAMGLALAVGFCPLVATTANARGVIAGFLEDTHVITPEQRQQFDDAHTAMNRPLDHVAAAGAGAVVGTATANPTLGAATAAGLDHQMNKNAGQ